MSGKRGWAPQTRSAPWCVTLELDEFGREALDRECERLGVPDEELVRFALVYYLADLDSGRIARQIPDGVRSGSGGP